MTAEYIMTPVGEVISPFREKFGIPRQAGIISTVESKIRLYKDFSSVETIRGLENFSHIWVVFVFHENIDKGWKNLVRPPRLGGEKKVGVFTSRSPFRPNFIGMSAVKLLDILVEDEILLIVRGGDFVDKTPVLDIKPYIKYADAIEDACSGEFGTEPQKEFQVVFSEKSDALCSKHKGLKESLDDILSYDLRPAYYKRTSKDKIFGIKFESFDVRFKIEHDILYIEEIEITH